MFDQLIVTLVSLVLGSVLTMAVTYVSQRMSSHADKQKVVREKIEELYTLTIQMKTWIQVQVLLVCKLAEITWHSDRPGWYVTDTTLAVDCPIDRIEMLVKLYIPSLKKPFAAYRQSVLEPQTLEGVLKRNESKYALEALAANKYYPTDVDLDDASEERKLEMVIDMLRNIVDTFDHYHEDFQKAIEKLA